MTNEEVKPFGNLNTFEQASKRLNISARTVRRLADRGEIKIIRVTKCSPRITDAAIDAFITAKAAGR
jgi:excisionase family DNA binding protein